MKHLLIIIALLFAFNSSKADSWTDPSIKEYYSADSSHFVRIVPRCVPEKYWKWVNASPRRKAKFSPKDTTIVPSHALMFKRTEIGDSLIWKEKLINQVAPVHAMVSDDGKYLVTFYNWYSVGYGVDVLVVYNEKGMMLKRHMLEDISPFPINTYPVTISSLWWRCGQEYVDNENVKICFKNDEGKEEYRVYSLEELKIL